MRCLAALVGGLAVLAALTAPTATSAGTDLGAGYACYSLASSTPADCLAWHNQPVRLVWYLQPGTLDSPAGNCTPTAFKADGQFPVSCTVLTNPGSPTPKTETTTVTVGVDMTPPTITAATPTRAADSGSWFNHPVSFAFGGTDATSGIVSCDTVTFAGPGGPGAQVVGGCHDAAGNYATRGFAVNYDNTPPKLRAVRAAPANRGATVTWTPSSDTVTSQVTRSPGRRGARSTVVYSGPAHRFRDKGMVNGRAYRYTVTVLDQAGNPASKTVAARPRVSLGLKPSRGARLTHPPLLRWPAVGGASYYNVQVYRGRVKVLSAWPKRAHLKLHRQWSFLGQRFRLTPGHYRWYVWPGYGSLPAQHFGAFIGQSSFRIVR